MRPTVSEQLDGICRILDQVVAPTVNDPYAQDVLVGVIATLDALGRGWAEVPAFLAWDTDRIAELLDGAGRPAPPTSDAHRSGWDIAALETLQAEAMRMLAAAIAEGTPPEVAHEIADHFRARAHRYPIKAVQLMPGQRLAR